MNRKLLVTIFLISISIARAKDEELPLCPINFQFFPQNLPMHCRMPTAAELRSYPGFPTMQPPQPVKPMPMPPSIPGLPLPGSNPMQGALTMPGPVPMPGSLPMQGSFPMPGPGAMPGGIPMMPMSAPAPNHKLPVIVMPFYSPDKSHNRPPPPHKRPRETIDASSETDNDSTDTDTDSDTDSSRQIGWWKGKDYGAWRKSGRRSNKKHRHHSRRRHNKKKQTKQDLLTPVLQYVTNDGYVIYEKTITKGEAKDWLRVNKDETKPSPNNENNQEIDASVHEDKHVDVAVAKSLKDNIEEDRDDYREDEKEREEVTTVIANPRRHHRRPSASAATV